jgi:Zn-dependent protease with chaperone function
MIFVLRGVAVALAFFLIMYCPLSMLACSGWELIETRDLVARDRTDCLFMLRILPAIAAGMFTLTLVVPSFLWLEPRVSAEPIGEIPLILGSLGLALLSAGVCNGISAQLKTTQAVTGWMAGAKISSSLASVPVFRIQATVPTLTLTGIRAHKVLLSEAAAAVLTPKELEAALRHELAHVRRRDNLKKLLFRFCWFPGMARLEAAWSDAEEIAADDAAVTDAKSAVELASALIKLSRLAPVYASAALTTSLVNRPATSINHRVARLMDWSEKGNPTSRRGGGWWALGGIVTALLTGVLFYGSMLRETHALTEWIVR